MRKKILAALLATALMTSIAQTAAAAERSGLAGSGLYITSEGRLLIADTYHHAIWGQTGTDAPMLIAGREGARDTSGVPTGSYQDGAITQAAFASPWSIAPYAGGWAVSDTDNHVIRYLKDETVRTAAGSGKSGYTDGMGTAAQFARPTGIAAGEDGSLFIADTDNHAIRLLDKNGKVSTIAGGTAGCADGTVSAARFREPTGLSYADGALYIADSGNHRICKLENGKITTIAGSKEGEDGSRNGAALSARFLNPQGVLANGGSVYIADTGNGAVRELQGGLVLTVCAAGSRAEGLYPAAPRGLAAKDGMLYVGDVFARTVFAVGTKGESFRDVPQDAWYAPAVRQASQYGLMNGSGDGCFEPDAEIDRAMFVTLLARLETVLYPDTVLTGKGAFVDVPAGAYYESAAGWAAHKNIAAGENGAFFPERDITRAELVTMLYRYAQGSGEAAPAEIDLSSYSDCADIPIWADAALKWAVDTKLIADEDGALMPDAAATRAQAAQIILRYITMQQ